jgi:hypothetical protein
MAAGKAQRRRWKPVMPERIGVLCFVRPGWGQLTKLSSKAPFWEGGNVMLRKILRSLGLSAITRHEWGYAFAAVVVLLLVWLFLLF